MSNSRDYFTSKLKKTGEAFAIRQIGEEDLFQLISLHKTIINNLKPGQECFIHKKSADEFVKIIESKDKLAIGTFVGKKLIGYSLANFVSDKTIDKVLPNFDTNIDPNKIVVLEQASVDPEYRGNNIASIMNACRQKIARQEYGKECAVTMVDIKNYFSYRNGFKNGMAISQATVDPDDGGHIVYLVKDFNNEFVTSKKDGFNISAKNMTIEVVNTMVENGYVGVGFDDVKNRVIFEKLENNLEYKKELNNNISDELSNQTNQHREYMIATR